MFNVTRLLDVRPSDRDRIVDEVRTAAACAPRWIVQPTLPGSRNGGDVLAHLVFEDAEQWRCVEKKFENTLADSAITGVNGACYRGDAMSTSTGTGATGTVYRTLLLRVQPGTDPDTIVKFEDELRSLPRYVPTIIAWQLCRVDDTVGTWTHVFEQVFTDVNGLMGPYLMHPMHWAVVDRWFDPECPEVIVRDRVCHSFCALTGAASKGLEPRGQDVGISARRGL